MMIHIMHAIHHGHHRILTRTVDTNVQVLAVRLAETLAVQDEPWLAFGTGNNFHYLADHELARSLGPEIAHAHPMFHALTSCDSVRLFWTWQKTVW